MTEHGRLYGIGVGPGDPELLTLKARRLIEEVDVVAFPTARRGPQHRPRDRRGPSARRPAQARDDLPGDDRDDGAPRRLRGGAERVLRQLGGDAGRAISTPAATSAILCEGDPLFYGSYIYLHERLAPRYRSEVVPGVTSFSAAAASAGLPLARRDEVLTILPGTLPADALATLLATSDAAVVIKLGRNFPKVREAARRAEVDGRAVFVERASSADELRAALADVDEDTVPYMSLVLVPGRADGAAPATGRLAVVGLGPAGPDWLTPEAHTALSRAEVLVGYGPYLARVPPRRGQERRASDNRAELERAREALELALDGTSVAVVSSGDPGIFAMAAAVYEAIEQAGERFAGVPVSIVAGVSAMQVAAARAGAPLGHDFCVISLSDQRKPWEVIEARLAAAASADLAIALYNPASQTRREQLARARDVLLQHRAAETPVVLARAVGSDEESLTITTLAGFDLAAVDMRTLILIGSSQTRVLRDASGAARVYTPRSYPASGGA